MRILAFDTSSVIASIAVVRDGITLAETETYVQAKHGEMLLPRIDSALKEARVEFSEIDLVAVGLGPGSFTGIRVALATAKGFAIAAAKPFVGVNSLRVLARGAIRGTCLVGTVVNAYRGEVYQALYGTDDQGRINELLMPTHARPKEAAERLLSASGGAPVCLCGDGARRYERQFFEVFGQSLDLADPAADRIRAANLSFEAERILKEIGPSDLTATEPLYLRPSDAQPPKQALRI
ncbi:MAG: tRNA (adenosine(37)-N6)-threonylcarbamoyltransferase complex dimerization subunit type 1 TsaB [Deltaproteobacteria bacterium]|nr:tRNA (adenosine(37)-N6)-threonylcarbamoyltransferase complex dimerization subunit type 1 TsaB [Deltaproteobacteria bacterium]